MKFLKTMLILIIVPIVCSVLCLSAFAEDVDFAKKGSISVSLSSNGSAISGGSVTVYYIASLSVADDEFVFFR